MPDVLSAELRARRPHCGVVPSGGIVSCPAKLRKSSKAGANVGRTINLTRVGVLMTVLAAEPAGSWQPTQATRSDVVLPDAHSFLLAGGQLAGSYRVFVALPPSYQSNLAQRYPVLYTLDANGGFPLITQTYRIIRVDGATPDLIIVGIGYEGTAGERRAFRERDLTPTRVPADSNTGGSKAFLAFVADTLIPYIDSNYRTVPSDRILHGHSLGGLFVLYTLFHQPDLFHRYIASSPSLWWDHAAILQTEAQFAKRQGPLAKSVFLSVGSDEPDDMRQHFQPLVDGLRSRNYSGFKLDAVVMSGEDHLSVIGPAFVRGLRAVFRTEISQRR